MKAPQSRAFRPTRDVRRLACAKPRARGRTTRGTAGSTEVENDYAVTLAAHSGQLQLNAFEPLNGLAPMESQDLLMNMSKTFRTKCIDGITVNEKVLAHYMETTVGIVTALNPVVGYDKATELAAEAYKSGKGILEVIREKKVLTEAQIKDLLDPVKLSNLDPSQYPKK